MREMRKSKSWVWHKHTATMLTVVCIQIQKQNWPTKWRNISPQISMTHLNDPRGLRVIGAQETHDVGVVVSQPHLLVSAFGRLLPVAKGGSRPEAVVQYSTKSGAVQISYRAVFGKERRGWIAVHPELQKICDRLPPLRRLPCVRYHAPLRRLK